MEKIDWVRKFTSRKFLLSLGSFVTMVMIACGGTNEKAAQISAIIMAAGSVIGYAIGEGIADSRTILYPIEGECKGIDEE